MLALTRVTVHVPSVQPIALRVCVVDSQSVTAATGVLVTDPTLPTCNTRQQISYVHASMPKLLTKAPKQSNCSARVAFRVTAQGMSDERQEDEGKLILSLWGPK